MAYATDVANLVAGQLSKFVTLNPHQLAGQVANLDFWLSEVRHALAVIDGYGVRFIQLHAAQEHYVAEYGAVEFDLTAGYAREQKASEVRRIPDRHLKKARRELIEAASRFLERCRNAGLLSVSQYNTALDSLGVDHSDEAIVD